MVRFWLDSAFNRLIRNLYFSRNNLNFSVSGDGDVQDFIAEFLVTDGDDSFLGFFFWFVDADRLILALPTDSVLDLG